MSKIRLLTFCNKGENLRINVIVLLPRIRLQMKLLDTNPIHERRNQIGQNMRFAIVPAGFGRWNRGPCGWSAPGESRYARIVHGQCICSNIFDILLILAYGRIGSVLVSLHNSIHLLALVGIMAKSDFIGKRDTAWLQS